MRANSCTSFGIRTHKRRHPEGAAHQRLPTPCRGFTLLEVLVAVTILGIILLTVYGTVSRTISTKEYAEERARLASVGREAVLRIADEIEGALSPPTAGALFQGLSSGTRQFADQVRFTIVSRPPVRADRRHRRPRCRDLLAGRH